MTWFRIKSQLAAKPAKKSKTWMFALLIPVCAIAPWAVTLTHGQDVADPSADPSAIIKAITAAKPSQQANQPPSLLDVARLTQELEAPGNQGYDSPISAKAAAGVATTPGRYQQIGRIQIPKIGLDTIYGEGVYAETLDHGPGHYPGTPLPGEPGTSVLSGHRNTHTAPFQYLNVLKKGDKVVVSVGKQKPTTFHVDDITIVPQAKYAAYVLRQAKDPSSRNLIMFACHPEGNPIFRIVVHATAGSSDDSKSGG